MKVLITGICGFVGSTLARNWLDAGRVEIVGLDNLSRCGSEENRLKLNRLGINVIHADMRCASDIESVPRADWVLDAAANPSVLAGTDASCSSRQVVEHNLLGTINVLEYCKRHRAGFIQLSTSRVYSIADLSRLPVEAAGRAFRLCPEGGLPGGISAAGVSEAFSTAPPISLYGSTKLASELLALEYGEMFGFPVWINRCGVLAGAGQFGRADQGIFAYWINAWLRRRRLAYTGFGGTGFQVRDCLHPRDLIPLLEKQTASNASGTERVFNLGGGSDNAVSLAELSAWCSARFGPHSVSADLNGRRFDIPWLVLDSSLARERWGWWPETPLTAILEEIAHHAEQNPDWLEMSGA
ncbi:MAG: CDP-tyvelose epimerase [Geobacteraceae bacterium GWC2_55_20]|nr:MAG: CDP-tyvelose epimerase [Geobacteraceae bacterium GWC2_55_20]OGU21411.1 MAG: CDP-tyvelose epimerase [Geobacteraceae bacterium GWF2_54_21]HBA71940.1 CDP-tyvelose epimerase [Geobacter sp.]HCE69666.1 CDP-tyvelose epimerase [Geobacter sp.]